MAGAKCTILPLEDGAFDATFPTEFLAGECPRVSVREGHRGAFVKIWNGIALRLFPTAIP